MQRMIDFLYTTTTYCMYLCIIAGHVIARAGSNISLACGGSLEDTHQVEWVCQGCGCEECPPHPGLGLRLVRFSDKITQWDNSFRRTLDTHSYNLVFSPVRVEDNGVYHCLINNQPDKTSGVEMIVEDVPDPPPCRPMIASITTRSITITWATPLTDNNQPVTSYRVFIRRGGVPVRHINTRATNTSYTVTGLQPFTTYSFRVSAQNILGLSEQSKESFLTQTHRESKQRCSE